MHIHSHTDVQTHSYTHTPYSLTHTYIYPCTYIAHTHTPLRRGDWELRLAVHTCDPGSTQRLEQ